MTTGKNSSERNFRNFS
eukprot:CCRYP_003438-RA/>CCRYP_003438-RA protein AED:0.49 eAED:1.00 QI:0/-1/0/1/-1/0/1/0/16